MPLLVLWCWGVLDCCWPTNHTLHSSCLHHTKKHMQGLFIRDTLAMLTTRKGGLHAQLEQRFHDAPREPQGKLKHFWEGVARVSNASHGELLDIWKQLLINCHLLVGAREWLAMLTWGVCTTRLRRGGPVSCHDFDDFYHLYRLALMAFRNSAFHRKTKGTWRVPLRRVSSC